MQVAAVVAHLLEVARRLAHQSVTPVVAVVFLAVVVSVATPIKSANLVSFLDLDMLIARTVD
jgi:hypothetical protein